MTATTIDRHDLTDRLAELRASRAALALRAARGDAGARAELATVDADIRTCEADLEVLALATEESRRLAAVAAEQDAAEERRRLEAAYVRADADRTAAYRRIEDTLTELGRHSLAAEAAATELDRLGVVLGRSPAYAWQWQARQRIKGRVLGLFWTTLGWPGQMPTGLADPLVPDDGGAA